MKNKLRTKQMKPSPPPKKKYCRHCGKPFFGLFSMVFGTRESEKRKGVCKKCE